MISCFLERGMALICASRMRASECVNPLLAVYSVTGETGPGVSRSPAFTVLFEPDLYILCNSRVERPVPAAGGCRPSNPSSPSLSSTDHFEILDFHRPFISTLAWDPRPCCFSGLRSAGEDLSHFRSDRPSHDLPLLHAHALFHQVELVVCINRDPLPRVAQDDQVAVPLDGVPE